jgi:hypothetical protein
VVGYIDAHPKTRFFFSPQVSGELASLGEKRRPNVTWEPQRADETVFYASEGLERVQWPANVHDLTRTSFGSWEVNFNYYPDWEGEDRILLMSIEQVRRFSVGSRFEPRNSDAGIHPTPEIP